MHGEQKGGGGKGEGHGGWGEREVIRIVICIFLAFKAVQK